MSSRAWSPEVTIERAVSAVHVLKLNQEAAGGIWVDRIAAAQEACDRAMDELKDMLDALGVSKHAEYWRKEAERRGLET